MNRATDTAMLRGLKITELLFRYVLDGLSNKEIADATGYSPTNVCRDMELLQRAGWVQRLDNSRWAISTKPVALMQHYQMYMAELAERGKHFETRVIAQAHQMMR